MRRRWDKKAMGQEGDGKAMGRRWDMHCIAFLFSWDITQPSLPPKSMWVVDSYNDTTAAVGIKTIGML